MRGTPWENLEADEDLRIIPAYAGNTQSADAAMHMLRDHPRVCGEHSTLAGTGSPLTGSSPRMRGTPCRRRRFRKGRGIIPAYAGNTSRKPEAKEFQRDHPRVCGEHRRNYIQRLESQGSSPRMRGTPDRVEQDRRRHGIIPAYAGNTSTALKANCPDRDHPRVCGEHVPTYLSHTCGRGSSPRMRGTLLVCAVPYRRHGIIPAYAGNTKFV